MTNRLTHYFEQEPEKKARRVDFWVVYTRTFRIFVDQSTALTILDSIDQRWPRPWLRFRDLFGDRMSLRSRDVLAVTQSTTDARAIGRLFHTALDAEESADRPWEDC
ncbi:MAG: hypothetical protein OEU54_05205 [Gemmatimonadota bacterium]|nr:hypothetical protein [Gemmatimonadota bacterium]